MVVLDVGSITGSVISVPMMGSRNSSGTMITYLSRCLAMIGLSMVVLDVGSITGSVIRVPMMGSRNSSGTHDHLPK